MDTNSYFDFAEDDYKFLKAAVYDGNARGNIICAISQNICEKYFKDIIDRFYIPDTEDHTKDKVSVLRTHSLRKLETFIEKNLGLNIEDSVKDVIEQADGYYFSTRYPGDESIEATYRDMNKCLEAVEMTRALHKAIAKVLQKKQEEAEQEEMAPDHTDEPLKEDRENRNSHHGGDAR